MSCWHFRSPACIAGISVIAFIGFRILCSRSRKPERAGVGEQITLAALQDVGQHRLCATGHAEHRRAGHHRDDHQLGVERQSEFAGL